MPFALLSVTVDHSAIILTRAQKNEIFDLVKTIVTKGAGKDAYAKRAKMLLEIFQCVHLKSGVRQVSADCNVANIITSTMKQVPTFTPGPTRESLGYYVAYCRRTSLGWENMMTSVTMSQQSLQKPKHNPMSYCSQRRTKILDNEYLGLVLWRN